MKLIVAALLNFLLSLSCVAVETRQTPKPAQSIAELQQQLEKILKETHTPGASVAIVGRDGPEWIAGLGTADVANDAPVTPETVFRIGSTSKGFVSLSILKLANEGKLSLQDPVHKLAPEVWFENRWEATDPVRVVDLLEHTAGWDDLHLREYAKDAPPTMGLREALDYDHHSRISRWPPGTRMAYCNSGPAVAAYLVEKITGRRFEDYVTENFFTPIGMKTASYFRTSAPATTHYHDDGKTPYPYWNILFRPAGSINASANDMAAYLAFYLSRGTVNGVEVTPGRFHRPHGDPNTHLGRAAGVESGVWPQQLLVHPGWVRIPRTQRWSERWTNRIGVYAGLWRGVFFQHQLGQWRCIREDWQGDSWLCHPSVDEARGAASSPLAGQCQFLCGMVRARLSAGTDVLLFRAPARPGPSAFRGWSDVAGADYRI